MLNQPVGVYGVSFDLHTHAIEDDLPAGWGLNSRGRTFNRVSFLLIQSLFPV